MILVALFTAIALMTLKALSIDNGYRHYSKCHINRTELNSQRVATAFQPELQNLRDDPTFCVIHVKTQTDDYYNILNCS